MAITPLLMTSQIEASRLLVKALDDAGFGVRAAYWLYNSDRERWRFNVATDGLNDNYGPKVMQAAEIVHAWRASSPCPEDILDLMEVSWIDASNSVVVGLLQVVKLGENDERRLQNRVIGGVYLEDVLVQRVAA